jgi:TolB protein
MKKKMLIGVVGVLTAGALAQPGDRGAADGAAPAWRDAEAALLSGHVQLTFRRDFVRAGEQYFDPAGRRVIFQAVPVPGEGQEPDPFYAMYVADVVADAAGGLSALANTRRVSPEGSANTCGWFHPTRPDAFIMGSTLTRPADDQKSGFQVGSRKYVWMFPAEMEIVEGSLSQAPRDPTPVFRRPNYDAEGSLDATGRFLLYAHVENEQQMGRPDANLYIYDTKTGVHRAMVTAAGYDGGPFFSPDGRWVCYRSDRRGDDLLQLFVAELRFERDETGVPVPVGVEREYQVTDNGHVNWAPYWHPSGEFLVYGSSEMGHQNYEVFAVRIDRAALRAAGAATDAATVKVDARRVRVTRAEGADVLPVFSPDGKWMMWTSQRGGAVAGEARPSSQVWAARWVGSPFGDGGAASPH